MWKVECDSCGKIEQGRFFGQPKLPECWWKVRYTMRGRTHFGTSNDDRGGFLLCGDCVQHWPQDLQKIRLDLQAVANNLEAAFDLAKGFGNQGNAAAMHIERALEYLTAERKR